MVFIMYYLAKGFLKGLVVADVVDVVSNGAAVEVDVLVVLPANTLLIFSFLLLIS